MYKLCAHEFCVQFSIFDNCIHFLQFCKCFLYFFVIEYIKYLYTLIVYNISRGNIILNFYLSVSFFLLFLFVAAIWIHKNSKNLIMSASHWDTPFFSEIKKSGWVMSLFLIHVRRDIGFKRHSVAGDVFYLNLGFLGRCSIWSDVGTNVSIMSTNFFFIK